MAILYTTFFDLESITQAALSPIYNSYHSLSATFKFADYCTI